MTALQHVLGIPFKRGARAAPIEYLEKAEIEALLAGIDRSSTLSDSGTTRMFSLMFNTGARVQEILDLRVRDVRLESAFQVRLAGKGNKVRFAHLAADRPSAQGPDPEGTCRRGKPGRSVHLRQ